MKGGKCRKTNVIYEANIVTDNNIHTYIGLSSNKIQKIAGHYTIINTIIFFQTSSSRQSLAQRAHQHP